jgi:hypothetical protein
MARKLADWLDSYLEYTDNSEPPKIYHKWVAISTVAAVLKRKCLVNWGTLRFYPNMYIVLVGPPGKARKGTAMAYGKDFLVRAQVKMAAESITREALVREICEAKDSVFDDDKPDVEFHSSLTVVAPELVVFLGYNQQQLMMDLTDWFDCGHGPEGRWTYRTKNMGTDDIIGVWVNLIGATTPDLLRSSLSMDAIGGGLTSRIIFVYAPDRGKLCPAPFLTKEAKQLREDLYYDLEEIHQLKGPFKPNNDFVNRWIEWYMSTANEEIFSEPHLLPYMERRPLHVMKISMILNAMRTDSMIMEQQDLERAIAMIEEVELDMPKVFTGMGQSPYASVMAKIMDLIGMRGKITKSELLQRFYNDVDERVMDAIINTLKEMGTASVLHDGTDTHVTYIPVDERRKP